MTAQEVIEKLKELAERYWKLEDPDFDGDLDPESWGIEVESYELIVDYAIEQKVPLGKFNIKRYQIRNTDEYDDDFEDSWMDEFSEYLLWEYPKLRGQIDKGFQDIIMQHEKLFNPYSEDD